MLEAENCINEISGILEKPECKFCHPRSECLSTKFFNSLIEQSCLEANSCLQNVATVHCMET